MGNQLTSAGQPVDAITCLRELPDHEYHSVIHTTRFLKTVRTTSRETQCLVKIFVKQNMQDTALVLQDYQQQVEQSRKLLERNNNVQAFTSVHVLDRTAFLVRPYYFSNLYDRLNTRPLLSGIEKRWIAFQLLDALKFCAGEGLCHGDIKMQNVLLTSWNWAMLADFATFKPALLPEDNPAAFSYLYDSSGRGTCCIAPERFFTPTAEDDNAPCKTGKLDPSSDVFSLGCVFAELFTDGLVLFDLSQMLAYRNGTFDVTKKLDRIDDPAVRELVSQMVQLKPMLRSSASACMHSFRETVFPDHFASTLRTYLPQFLRQVIGSDQRVARLYKDWPMLQKSIAGDSLQESGFAVIAALLCSCVRSLSSDQAKMHAVELLARLCVLVEDDCRLDRILPYLVFFFADPSALVRASAIRVMTDCLCSVSSVRLFDVTVFSDFVFDSLKPLVSDDEPLVRTTVAQHLARLCCCAFRFLRLAQHETTDGPSFSFDTELGQLRAIVKPYVEDILKDSNVEVKLALLSSEIDQLCVFLGPALTQEAILMHVVTFFNDQRSWRLKAAFYNSIGPIIAYVGQSQLSSLFTFLEDGLADAEPSVIESALQCLISMTSVCDPVKLATVLPAALPMLVHPGPAIRSGAAAFVCELARVLDPVDRWTLLTLDLEAYQLRPTDAIESPAALLASLRPPLFPFLEPLVLTSSDPVTTVERLVAGTFPCPSESLRMRLSRVDDHQRQNLKALKAFFSRVARQRATQAAMADSGLLPGAPAGDHDGRIELSRIGVVPMKFDPSLQSSKPRRATDEDVLGDDDQEIVMRLMLNRRGPRVDRLDRTARTGAAAQTTRQRATSRATRGFPIEGTVCAHLCEHTRAVTHITAPDEQPFFVTGSDDGSVRMWTLPSGAHPLLSSTARIDNVGGRVTGLACCGDKQPFVVVGTDRGTVSAYRFQYAAKSSKAGRTPGELDHAPTHTRDTGEGAITAVQRLPLGDSCVVYSTVAGKLHGWDLRTDRETFTLNNQILQGLVRTIVVDANQNWLTLATARGMFSVWDLRFMLPVATWRDVEHGPAIELQLLVDEKSSNRVISANGSETVCIYDVQAARSASKLVSVELLREDPGLMPQQPSRLPHGLESSDMPISAPKGIRAACTTPGFIVTASSDANIRVWNLATPKASFVFDGSLKGRTQYTERLAPVPTIVESYLDGARVTSSGSHVDAVTQVRVLGPEGNQVLVSAGRDGVIKMWR
eukprot:m.41534 g.41534  ORF g.41534 m.41534 type:complete len:1232 (+) comp10516_c0_seq1:25-3720(+)